MATGILLPSYNNQFSNSNPNRSSASSINSDASTSRLAPSTHSRRIRFAPLPDPHRAVLITDDGDELPIALPNDSDLNHIPTSLLISSPPASPRHPLTDIRPDPSDERENSSGSSYLSSSSSTSASSTSTPRTTTPSDVSPISSLTSSPVTANSALPATKCTPPLLASQSSSAPSSWSKPRYISSLLPFRRSSTSSSSSSSHTLTPTPSLESQGQGHAHTARKAVAPSLTLFRTSSRDSTDSTSTATTSGWGLGLSRWTSANANEKPTAPSINGSSPLARTQSTQSYKSKSKMSLFASSSSSSPPSSEVPKSQFSGPKLPGQNRYKGARMLNGRVYGSKRPSTANANPFANARDEDVEFVEWGYGGMGSVKGAKSAGIAGGSGVNWERLQGGASTRQGVGGGFGVADDDGDDGSGMGWVKKRREERERKKAEELAAKEKEKEKEKEAQQVQSDQEAADSTKSTPTPTRASTMDGLIPKEVLEGDPTSAATIVPSAYIPTDAKEEENVKVDDAKGELKEGFVFGGAVVDEPVEQEKEREHVPLTVLVPVRPRHHHHHHRHARSLSKEGLLDESTCDHDHDDSVTSVEQQVGGEGEKRDDQSASESESETEDEDEDEEDGNRPEEDDEYEEEEDDEDESKVTSGQKQRKTALGAGVEKISRHKEKE